MHVAGLPLRRPFQFTLLLMLLMTAVAAGCAWLPMLPIFWEPLKWICKLSCVSSAVIAGMCLPAHLFRGVEGLGQGIVFCGIFGCCVIALLSFLGRDLDMSLAILVGGFLGGVITGFLGGVVGAIVAWLLDELT